MIITPHQKKNRRIVKKNVFRLRREILKVPQLAFAWGETPRNIFFAYCETCCAVQSTCCTMPTSREILRRRNTATPKSSPDRNACGSESNASRAARQFKEQNAWAGRFSYLYARMGVQTVLQVTTNPSSPPTSCSSCKASALRRNPSLAVFCHLAIASLSFSWHHQSSSQSASQSANQF